MTTERHFPTSETDQNILKPALLHGEDREAPESTRESQTHQTDWNSVHNLLDANIVYIVL